MLRAVHALTRAHNACVCSARRRLLSTATRRGWRSSTRTATSSAWRSGVRRRRRCCCRRPREVRLWKTIEVSLCCRACSATLSLCCSRGLLSFAFSARRFAIQHLSPLKRSSLLPQPFDFCVSLRFAWFSRCLAEEAAGWAVIGGQRVRSTDVIGLPVVKGVRSLVWSLDNPNKVSRSPWMCLSRAFVAFLLACS